MVQRKRVTAHAAPPNPQTLAALVLPAGYLHYATLAGNLERWLKIDQGNGDSRMLLFSTNRNLDLLARSEVSHCW